MSTLKAGEMVRFGWETFKKRPWFFAGITLLIWLVTWIIGVVTDVQGASVPLAIALFLLGMIAQTVVDLGGTNLSIRAHDAPESVNVRDLWRPERIWHYLLASILTGLIVVVGLVLLIVPGIIFALMLFFAKYLVVDRGLAPIEAIKESARITKGHKWQLLWFGIVLALLNILGALLLLVGLLVTIPVSMLAAVHAYRTLEHKASEVTLAA